MCNKRISNSKFHIKIVMKDYDHRRERIISIDRTV